MAKKSTGTGVGVGGSSILVIFILLCLTTFATLSMVSANADLRLTEKSAVATREFYDADSRAELILAEIDGVLLRNQPLHTETGAYMASCMREIEQTVESAVLEQDPFDLSLSVRYTVPVNDVQQLAVTVQVLPNRFEGKRYERREWTVVSVDDWVPESEGFQLWDGGEGGLPMADGDILPPMPGQE